MLNEKSCGSLHFQSPQHTAFLLPHTTNAMARSECTRECRDISGWTTKTMIDEMTTFMWPSHILDTQLAGEIMNQFCYIGIEFFIIDNSFQYVKF